MGSCLDCFKKSVKKTKSPESGLLKRAQLMTETAKGKAINCSSYQRVITRAEMTKLCQKSVFIRKISNFLFIEFNKITNDLFLTGIGGIVDENLKMCGVKCIVNATYEMPLLKVKTIETFRVPVADEENENISIYFDEVSDQINKWIKNNKKVVVHCVCGISRSATLVLAYLIKYKKWSLKSSYEYVKTRRGIIQPNHSFFQQLIDYEKKILKKTSVHMISYTLKNGRKIKIPDFILKQFPGETEREDFEQSIDSTLNSIFSEETINGQKVF